MGRDYQFLATAEKDCGSVVHPFNTSPMGKPAKYHSSSMS